MHFKVGDKVKLSNKVLENYNGSHRDFVSKYVYQIVDKYICGEKGVMLKLHCGTFLLEDEAVKVNDETPLRT